MGGIGDDDDTAINEMAFQSNVPPDENPNKQGFGLGRSHVGFLMGSIELPKFAVWTIQFLVTKRCPERINDKGNSAQGVRSTVLSQNDLSYNGHSL